MFGKNKPTRTPTQVNVSDRSIVGQSRNPSRSTDTDNKHRDSESGKVKDSDGKKGWWSFFLGR